MAWYNSLKDLVGDVAHVAPAAAGFIPGVGPLISGALSHIPGMGSVQEAAGHIPGLGAAADWLTGNGGKNALGVAEGANAAMLTSKANNYANNAADSVTGSYNARAPLRAAGQAAMLNPGQGIAAKIAAVPRGANPYAQAPAGPPQIGRAS